MYAGACDVIHIVIHIAEPGKRERSESEKASGLIQASSLLPIAAQSQLQDQWRGECHAQARLKIVKIVKIVKAGASQLGKKHPARLLGRHTLGKLGWRPSERTDAGVPELGRSI